MSGFSCGGAWAWGPWASSIVAPSLQSTGSIVAAQGLSCSEAMWDLPASGIEPASRALAGGFFTAEPPGKPVHLFLEHLPWARDLGRCQGYNRDQVLALRDSDIPETERHVLSRGPGNAEVEPPATGNQGGLPE